MPEDEGLDRRPLPQQSSAPFYKNLWFWIAIVVFLIFAGKEASGLFFKGNPFQANKDSLPIVTQEAQPQTPAQIATQAGQFTANSPATVNTQQNQAKQNTQRNEIIKKALSNGQAAVAKTGQQYPFEILVLFNNKDVGLCVDQFGCKLEYTGNATVHYYVDFGFFNGTDQPYNWYSSQFKLIDTSGYSYSPVTYLARGDSSGIISPQSGGRGEVVFEIPAFQDEIAQTTLVFTTNEDPSQIYYSLNLQDFNNYYWQEQQKRQQNQISQEGGQT
ncbi:MAG: DUF4352 domain-containing protein [Thermacetogeniaceae bacterium]